MANPDPFSSEAPASRRIASLIASATETVCALDRGDWLVGRSHECDYPPEVMRLPVLTAPKFAVEGTSGDIHRAVQEIVRDGLSIYRVDAAALAALAPDIIVTQDHCEVCAVSLADVEAALCQWAGREVQIVSLRPNRLLDIYTDISHLAGALGALSEGAALIGRMRGRIADIETRVCSAPERPRVAFIEWVNPLMAGGNWMPELVEAVGGVNLFGEAGARSGWMEWPELCASDPDVIVVAPCGFDIEMTLREMPFLERHEGWHGLGAVRSGRVLVADGNAYFNRPGPRLADTAEMLAEILHPDMFDFGYRGTGWVRYRG